MSATKQTNTRSANSYNTAMWDADSKEQLAWGRLKLTIGGLFPTTQVEQWLLLNDFAALGLETEALMFPPPE
jgi:hypothetical protein